MIYDRPITICTLPATVGSPLQGTLERSFSCYGTEMTVYSRRYWEAQQAGAQIDLMLQLPSRLEVDPTMFAAYGGHIYRIRQVQFQPDADGLPSTVLSLERSSTNFDIAAPSGNGRGGR